MLQAHSSEKENQAVHTQVDCWIFCSEQVVLYKEVCFIGTHKCDAAALQRKERFQCARTSSINTMR